MARLEKKLDSEAAMRSYVTGILTRPEAIKKIDVRAFQHGYKVIIKTIDPTPEPAKEA